MNFEHYKNFVTIVDTGTISGAAEKLLIAQPALSKQVQQLEEKYGAQLVIRRPRHIELTDAGKILYDKIKSICYLEDAAQKEIDSCVSGNRGTLRLGRTPAHPDTLLDQLLLDFHRAYPEVTFEIFEQNSDRIIELLDAGMIEVGIVRSQHFIPSKLKPVLTVREKMMAYFHRGHPALSWKMDAIPLGLLADWPISISSGLRSAYSLACENAGFHPNYMNVSASRSLSMLWAADRKTVSIVVSPTPFDEGDYCCRRIAVNGMDTMRSFTVAKERRISAVARSFLEFCCEHHLVDGWDAAAPQDTEEGE